MTCDRSNTQRDSRELAKSGKLFCPHCYATDGSLRSISFRSGGELKRDHFFHPKSDLTCHYSPMTEKHINAQSWIADHLSRKYPDALVKREMQLRKSKEELCRPDICVVLPDGAKFAYEIQVSKITEYEVKNRTEKLQSNGCKAVTWFFTELSDSLLIQECLALKKQYHALIYFEEDSSVDSISVTDLKAIRRSLLQKLWNDHCLKQAEYWSFQSRFQDKERYHRLMNDPAFKIDMQVFADILTIESFRKKASEIYESIFFSKKQESPIKQKTVFDLLGENQEQNKPKSYNLPMPHYVVSLRDDVENYGDCLSDAMEVFGGMRALYELKEDDKNCQAFKDLYNPKVEEITFGDDGYGFRIYKGNLALLEEELNFLEEELNYALEHEERPCYVVIGNVGAYGISLAEAMNDHGGMDMLYCFKTPETKQFFKDLYNPAIKKLSSSDEYVTIYRDELAINMGFNTYEDYEFF